MLLVIVALTFKRDRTYFEQLNHEHIYQSYYNLPTYAI